MLNSVASQSIRHLFTQSDEVEVEIRCSPSSKLLQGAIDSFKMRGTGLVIRRQFRAETMSFETDAVAIDFGAILGGNIRLKRPTQAIAQVTLTEQAINEAFTADLVQKRITQVDDEDLTGLSGGEPLDFRDVAIKLLPEQRVKLSAKTDLPNRDNVPISLQATLAVERRRRITFDDAEFDADGVSPDVMALSKILTQGFIRLLNNMVDLDRFDLDGVMMRINRLETKGTQLIFSGYAQIDHFPSVK
ncbi:MAG: DUF2993 domain-containing protein [Cyanobacteria bacterium P01_H01_bin.119]